MVRAILHNGTISPVDPLPPTWREGQALRIEELGEVAHSAESLDKWYQELEALCAEGDPEDHKRLEAALAEADEQAKAIVRKQMGLQ